MSEPTRRPGARAGAGGPDPRAAEGLVSHVMMISTSIAAALTGPPAWVRDVCKGSEFSVEAQIACSLAVDCGRAMVTAVAAQRKKTLKDGAEGQGIDPVTATDFANEALVTETLRTQFPDYEIIGEEASSAAGCVPPLDPAIRTWVVDPLDGTQNFCKGLPLSCVSIGLCVDGEPALGCVYDPYRDELFLGVADMGAAYCDGERISADSTCLSLPEAIVGTDLGYERSAEGVARIAAVHAALLEANTFGVRNFGSTVLSVVWVSCGRANGFYSGLATKDCPKPWDWCAAAAIGMCSGVSFRRLGGSREGMDDELPFRFDAPSGLLCASTPELADELLGTLQRGLRK